MHFFGELKCRFFLLPSCFGGARRRSVESGGRCPRYRPAAGAWERGPAGRRGVCVCARTGSVKERGTRGGPPMASSRLCSPFSGVVPSFDRYICLARNIGYQTIKPMTKYCPIFILSLAGVQQERNSLACNYGAPICEKLVQ